MRDGPRIIVRHVPPLLLAACLACGCAEPPAPADQAGSAAATGLETLVVESARVPRETAFDGAVEAVNQATVSAQTTGRVVELPYDVGDFVEKGSVIVRFTTTEQRARTAAQEAALAEATARLAESRLAYDRMK
jgi:multidrug efflux pump subunit AcrA (membrane-fusion protein)